MLIPSSSRLHRETPIQAHRRGRVILEDKQCVWHSTETHSTLLCVFGGEKNHKHAAVVGMWMADVKGNTCNFFVVWADGFPACLNVELMMKWENSAWTQELAQWRLSLNPGHGFQGFVQMRAEQAWESPSLPDHRSPLSVWERASVCMQADMPRRDCEELVELVLRTKCWRLQIQGKTQEVGGFRKTLNDGVTASVQSKTGLQPQQY